MIEPKISSTLYIVYTKKKEKKVTLLVSLILLDLTAMMLESVFDKLLH